jgi:hypothetical protein
VLSLPGVSNVIVGCQTPAEVDQNAAIVRQFAPLSDVQRKELEQRTHRSAATFAYYKRATR